MFQTIHYIMIIAGSLAMGLPQLTHAMPPSASPWILAASSVCALVATVLGAVSGSAGNQGASITTTVTQVEKEGAPKLPPPLPMLFMSVIAGITLMWTVAIVSCTKQQEQQVAADLSDVGACVLNRAEAGEEPLNVVGECAASGIEAVIKIVQTFLAAAPPHEAGALSAHEDRLRAFLVKAKAAKP